MDKIPRFDMFGGENKKGLKIFLNNFPNSTSEER
jgi:hypothetical protein